MSTQALSDLLHTLYAAPADPQLWQQFLRDFSVKAKLTGAAILHHDMEHAQYNVQTSSDGSSEWEGLYRQHYGQMDEYRAAFLHKARVAQLALGDELCPQHVLEKTEFYNDFLLKYDIRLFGAMATIKKPNLIENISLYQSWKGKSPGIVAMEALNRLYPHMQSALQLQRHMIDLKAQASYYEGALDLTPTAIILLKGSKVVAANGAAQRLLAGNDGLSFSPGGLATFIPSESARLQALIRNAVATLGEDRITPTGAMLVSRKDRSALQVFVAPTCNLSLDMGAAGDVVVLVAGGERPNCTAEETLRMLFGLTAAECHVARLLADGLSAGEIRDTLGVSANTLKSQFSSIYSKTNTARQTQLVRLMCLLPHV